MLPVWLGSQTLTLLVTADMHGWLEPVKDGGGWEGGAAETLEAWRNKEGLAPGQALVLSCGDDYTGPAISTYFKGDSTNQALNAMGYDASALGNHEFDFGVAKLGDWAAHARFPFLACNLTPTAADAPDLPVQPFKIFTVHGAKVGVVGLTVRGLPGLANSADWDGTDYARALRMWVPKAKAAGAQVVVVIGHVPFPDLKAAAEGLGDLGVPVYFGGHSHETTLGQADNGAWVVNPGCFWRQYARVDLDVEPAGTKVLDVHLAMVRGPRASAKTVAALGLPAWQKKLAAVAGPTLGFTAQGLPRHWALSNLVTDAWLAADPRADLAVCNYYGLRQDLPSGPVNNLQLLSVMPFDDKLVALALTGRQLLAFLPQAGAGFFHQSESREVKVMAGLRESGNAWRLDRTGKAVDPKATYRVLTNDYLADHDAALHGLAYEVVRANWRDPLADWLKAHPSDETHPLDTLVDAAPRAKD